MKTAVAIVAILTAGLGNSLSAETKVLTDREGRKIEAEIVALRNDTVYLRMSGRNFEILLEQLTNSDQEWVKDWATRNVNYQLDFSARENEVKELWQSDRKRDKVEGKESWEKETWFYEVEITNRSGFDLENLVVQYQYVIRHTRSADLTQGKQEKIERPELKSGTKKIERLANTDRSALTLEQVVLEQHDWQKRGYTVEEDSDGETYADYYWDDYSDEAILDGLWVRIYQKGILVSEWKSNGKLIKQVDWAGPPPPPPPPRPAASPRSNPGISPKSPSIVNLQREIAELADALANAIAQRLPQGEVAQIRKRYEEAQEQIGQLVHSR